jgi:hypothetical protein
MRTLFDSLIYKIVILYRGNYYEQLIIILHFSSRFFSYTRICSGNYTYLTILHLWVISLELNN